MECGDMTSGFIQECYVLFEKFCPDFDGFSGDIKRTMDESKDFFVVSTNILHLTIQSYMIKTDHQLVSVYVLFLTGRGQQLSGLCFGV